MKDTDVISLKYSNDNINYYSFDEPINQQVSTNIKYLRLQNIFGTFDLEYAKMNRPKYGRINKNTTYSNLRRNSK